MTKRNPIAKAVRTIRPKVIPDKTKEMPWLRWGEVLEIAECGVEDEEDQD